MNALTKFFVNNFIDGVEKMLTKLESDIQENRVGDAVDTLRSIKEAIATARKWIK